MNKKPYSSAIKKTPYKYYISKKIASLMIEKMDRNDIFTECVAHNYIEIDSAERRREVTSVIYERLQNLDIFLLKQFLDSDISTSKFILTYAIAKTDSLFFDFMFEVYREASVGSKNYISLDDFDNFFEAKKETDIIVSQWGNFTLTQLGRGYRNILVDSGLGIRDKRNMRTVKCLVNPEIENHIQCIGQAEFLKVLLGEK